MTLRAMLAGVALDPQKGLPCQTGLSGVVKTKYDSQNHEMSEVNNEVPQAGRTKTGPESRPIGKMGCPTDSGGGIQTTLRDELTRDQVGSTHNATGPELDIANPFKRRDSLLRSPPRPRASSLSDVNEALKIGQANKRKRTEGGKTPGSDWEKETNRRDIYKDALDKIGNLVRKLDTVLRETYKPKQELKDLAGKLLLQVEKLQNAEISEWLEGKINGSSDQGSDALKNEIQDLRTQLARTKEAHKKEKDDLAFNHVQCDKCKEERRKEARRQLLTKDDSYDTFKQATEKDWGDEIFPKPRTQRGNIWEAPHEYALVLPCKKDLTASDKAVARAIERLGGQDDLIKQGKEKGEVAMMLHSLSFPDNEGKFTGKSRVIYYPIVSGADPNEISKDEWLLQSLKIVKDHAIQHKTTKLAIPEIGGITGTIVGRMVGFVFINTNIEVVMYKEQDDNRRAPRSIRGRLKSTQAEGQPSKPTRPRSDALLVRMPNMKYADLLKMVKENINPTDIGVEVRDIKKTRNDELLLTVQNDPGKLDVLKEEIKSKLPEANTSRLTTKKVIHIKDLDEITTVHEIREAIVKTTSVKPDSLEIRALRPAYGSRQNVTVVLPQGDAEKLIAMGGIKIGWTKCRVLERKIELKCFKCWEYGHTRTQCRGPDREHLCLKCGQDGHKAVDCRSVAYCVHCKKEGHQSGSPKCPINLDRRKSEASRPTTSKQ